MTSPTGSRFNFAAGNIKKLLLIPGYLLGFLLCLFVPRNPERWVFASHAGVGEGALPLASQVRSQLQNAQIFWLSDDTTALESADRLGFTGVKRSSLRGFWVTARSAQIVVTHGLGDANRFGVFGAAIVQLWHGAPLKKIHLDSAVTTRLGRFSFLKKPLHFMYRRAAGSVAIYPAGSLTAARRLRSAFRVLPGKVQILGDPRHDPLIKNLASRADQKKLRAEISELADLCIGDDTKILLYAPTWRDGSAGTGLPGKQQANELLAALERLNAVLVVRPHPLSYFNDTGFFEHPAVGLLDAASLRDLTPHLAAFDAVITDYSSVAIDFAITKRPIFWYAHDIAEYGAARGLYEPLELTAQGRICATWQQLARALTAAFSDPHEYDAHCRASKELAARFHAYSDGRSAARVLAAILELRKKSADLVPPGAAFFESFYGRQVSDNPLALDREISARSPKTARYWSVADESIAVPQGAQQIIIGSPLWHAARSRAELLIVNDWLRFGFRRGRSQFVLQTWHGTMLKNLALLRPKVSLRTRLAVHRQSRQWSAMLSQNPHATEHFKRAYAFSGQIFELGYPRCDALAAAVVTDSEGVVVVNPVTKKLMRERLGATAALTVAYLPTWRQAGGIVDELQINELAKTLGDSWNIIARGHTRSITAHGYAAAPPTSGAAQIIDASRHDDINDILLAADVIITDYSSVMFDASVAHLPQLFFVPDIADYRDRERGFSFDFESAAPGPLLGSTAQVTQALKEFEAKGRQAAWVRDFMIRAAAWRARYNPHDDGAAAARVANELCARSLL